MAISQSGLPEGIEFKQYSSCELRMISQLRLLIHEIADDNITVKGEAIELENERETTIEQA